jgi:toxin ParE1/3/4
VTRWTVSLTVTARRDLAQVIAVIAKNAGSRTAARWRRGILDQISLLSSQPYLGAHDELLGRGRRRLILTPYLIVYEFQSANEIMILRIIHGARDLPALFEGQIRQ